MPSRPALKLPTKTLVAILLTLVCVHFFLAWAVNAYRNSAVNEYHAINLTRLIALPILLLIVWLTVRRQKIYLKSIFSLEALTLKLVLTGLGVGILARILSWAQITARGSFGLLQDYSPSGIAGPSFGFDCPATDILIVAAVIWLVLVPLTEEFIHRGIIQSAFEHRGPVVSITLSATLFTLMHRPDSYLWVFLFGILFGIQFWQTRTLWLPMITHAAYDGMNPIDKLCLSVAWSPEPSSLPLLVPGISSSIVALICIAAISFLSSRRWVGSL